MRHHGTLRGRLRAQLRVPIIFCCLILAGGAVDVSAAAGAGSSTSTATSPQQLVHAYPLGPKRLCCNGQSGSTGQSRSRPAAGSPQGQTRSAGQPAGGTGRASSSSVILLVVGALGALLIVAKVSATYRRRRRFAPPEPSDCIERVKALQGQLTWLGVDPGPMDGRHGALTTDAVMRFQEAHDLPVDGVVGPLTAHALRASMPEPRTTERIERIRALQNQLSWLGLEPGLVDGRYGPLTTGAVMRFQQAHDLPVDGVVGPLTADALRASMRERPTTDRTERVKALQRQLTALGLEPGLVDGRYGPLTTDAVKRFQVAHDLRVDGVVDPLTQNALQQSVLQQPRN